MSTAIETEPYLVLETNRSIFRSGESAEVLQRWLSASGFSPEMRPPVQTFLSTDVLAANVFDVPEPVETSFLKEEAAIHVGIVKTEGLPSGSYLLQALGGESGKSIEAEQSIVVLSDEEYGRFWLDLAEEKVIDPEMIELPEDLLAALHACTSSERLKQQLAASDIALPSIRLTDARTSDILGPLPPLSRAVFDWVHTHLLAAAYEMAFGGGYLVIDLFLLDDTIWTQIEVEQRQTQLSHGWPSYLKYVELGAGAEIKYDHLSESRHLVQCSLAYNNPLLGPSAAAGTPVPATG